MKAHEYILTKQTAWARRRGISLIGSQGGRGCKTYAPSLNENLFAPLLPSTQQSFLLGDGNELGTGTLPGKMQAVHSSSALGVNVFQYWKSIGEPATIAAACHLCKPGSTAAIDLDFEVKLPIHNSFTIAPNLDVVIRNREGERIQALGVECKYSESYGQRGHSGLKPAYLQLEEIWSGLPRLREFSKTISPDDSQFQHLHAAQLVKHILGLKRAFGPRKFRLLYLWYDVLGPEGALHTAEVETFAAVARLDGVQFHSLTYQELICGMSVKLDGHGDYLGYLMDRYV
jgi:hypothetical protein